MVLVADDNPEMRAVIRKVVSSLLPSEEIIECETGRQAVESYASHRPRFALMDLRMREMDGLTATATIKSEFPEAHIIIVTNFDDAVLREEAKAAGAEGYVTKDNLAELKHCLEY